MPNTLCRTARAGLLGPVLAVLVLLLLPAGPPPRAASIGGKPPYPASAYLTGTTLDWSTYRFDAYGSDNWATTWAADGNVYASFGDGGGFGVDAAKLAYVSIGFARLAGSSAATVSGVNLSRLYAHLTPGSSAKGYAEARLYASTLGANDWTRAGWAFTPTGPYPIIGPAFVQAGRNDADAPDGFVYAYATRYAPLPAKPNALSIQRGPTGGEITLMRAARGSDLLSQASWSFYAGTGGDGAPIWNPQQAGAKSVFVDKNGVGWTMSAAYVKVLGRYLILTANTKPYAGRLGIFEAPRPWGPWRTVFYGTVANSAAGVPANAFFFNFLADSFSTGGTRFTLVFSGHKPIDGLNLVDGSFTLNPAAR